VTADIDRDATDELYNDLAKRAPTSYAMAHLLVRRATADITRAHSNLRDGTGVRGGAAEELGEALILLEAWLVHHRPHDPPDTT
jgi:hypothetical protein